jgi:hypothetical protein
VVTKDIPPLSFAGGVPARVIGPVDKIVKHVDREELFKRAMDIAEDLPDFFGFKSETRRLDDALAVVEFERRKRLGKHKWYLLVTDPERTKGKLDRMLDPERRIIFSTGALPEESCKNCYAWFNLKNLRCSDISDSFAFEIWNFLRHTWCVTCTIAENKN